MASRIREWLRSVGKRVALDHANDMAAIRAAKRIGAQLQSFNVALGTSPADHRHGIVQFGNRWYFYRTADERKAMADGQDAVDRIKLAILEVTTAARISVRFTSTPKVGRILV